MGHLRPTADLKCTIIALSIYHSVRTIRVKIEITFEITARSKCDVVMADPPCVKSWLIVSQKIMKNIKFHLSPKYSCDQNHENIVTNSGKSTLLSRIFTCFSMGGLFSGVLPYKAIRQKRAFLQNTRKIRTRVHNIPINNSSRKSKHFKYCVGRVLWQNAHNLTRYRLGKFIIKSKIVLFWCILLGLHDLIMSMIEDHGHDLKEHPPPHQDSGGGAFWLL